MFWVRRFFIGLIAVLLWGCSETQPFETASVPTTSMADYSPPERLALVIGNEAYSQFTPRPGAREDADLVARALQSQGFTLVGGRVHHDLDWGEMVRWLRVMEAQLQAEQVAVLYYAGHVVNVDNANFLVPVGVQPWTQITVDTELVRLSGSLGPPSDREPRIKLLVLDRYLPGPLTGAPTPVVENGLAHEVLAPNEARIYGVASDSLSDAGLMDLNRPIDQNRWFAFGGNDDMSERSIVSRAFTDALRSPFVHVLGVMYQVGVMVADHTSDLQHVDAQYGDAIPAAGPLIGTGDAGSIVSRLEIAAADVQLEFTGEDAQPVAPFVSEIVQQDTRSAQSVSDTVAVLTVLNIEDVFPEMRAGRDMLTDDAMEAAQLEAWRSVLEQSRASLLDDYQKAAILSVTSSTSSGRLHRSGIADILESGDFSEMPEAIEALAREESRTGTAQYGLERRRLVERALFETRQFGTGAGGIIQSFWPEGRTRPPERVRNARVNQARDAVASCAPRPLNANQLEALTSFALSITIDSFLASSVCRRLSDGDLYAVARELSYSTFNLSEGRIVHDPALVRRRARETALFLTVTEGAARDNLARLRLARAVESEAAELATGAPAPATQAAAQIQVAQNFRRADHQRLASFMIRMFEGLRLNAYQDAVGVWTIGFGSTGPDVGPGLQISEREAHDRLIAYVEEDWAVLREGLSWMPPATETAAVLSLSYNVGRQAVLGSTLLEHLNARNEAGAADQFLVWDKARVDGELVPLRGLSRRRMSERALFLMQAERPLTASDLVVRHLPVRLRAERYGDDQELIGYGHIQDESGPNRIDQDQALALLQADLEAVRAQMRQDLRRPVQAAQLEAMTALAFITGVERFQASPMITYLNEGNLQAALAVIGYWDRSGRGATGAEIENWDALRADMAALFVMGC